MPVLTLHWDLGKRTGLLRNDNGPGSEARLHILVNLMSRANIRLRAWPGVDTIMEDTGFNDKTAIASAIKWLSDRGAIYNVPFDKRVGEERRLSPRKYVFQLTGIIELDGKPMPYLLMKPEEMDWVLSELREIGAEHAVELIELLNGRESLPLEGDDGRDSLRN